MMARKQREDSSVERSAERHEEDHAWVPGTYMEIPVPDLRVGMQIVTTKNPKTGKAMKSSTVKSIEKRRGCLNLHINDNWCYDLVGKVEVRSHMVPQSNNPGALLVEQPTYA